MSKKLRIYIDGGARGNPGPAGIGVLILNEKNEKVKEVSKYLGPMTNNAAEYHALIQALKEAKDLGAEEITLNMDSELVAKQIKGEFRVKNDNIRTLFDEAVELINGFRKIEVKHIDRSLNKEADRLANKAMNLSGLKTEIE
jgi:ribonuclease HI